ncbi:hypothetical protein B0H15DRAFT_919926 [Mycena belliarum]|uniref:Uncharacterized protein n=1 Tax=Mycena belliarum TaxID=1033014 RepID=A0AAD6Y0D1_9AGAR|nr:hypothetical protein B0H15DRAFT_919926 [Mycena belliae]
MHLVWENVIKTLILLWAGEHKGMDEGSGEYHLGPTVFEAIGAAGKASGDTIPSCFGPRVPDIVKERYYFIADTWSVWTMSLGPVLLRRRFKNPVYYTHFVSLVRLLHLCLQFEISSADIDTIETGMATWVEEFERLYYQYNLERLPVCTLPIHGLLHIAASIRIMGPSWCYWAYPMERFCGSLLPAIKSRRYPWASIDRRILELAQLFQIKAIYSLSTALDLRPRRKLEMSGMTLAAYPRCVLVYPRELRTISTGLRNLISKYLASIYPGSSEDILPLITAPIEHWGKIQWLNGGDMMHASDIGKHGTRDMTYVKVQSQLAFNGNYGQLRLLLVVKLEPSEVLGTTTTKIHLLAVVARSIMTQKNRLDMPHTKGQFRAVQIIDADDLEFVVGRVPDRGEYVFIERVGCGNVLEAYDDPEQAVVPRNHRQTRVQGL